MGNFLKVFVTSALVVIVAFSLGATKSDKTSKHAWLGVVGQSVSEELAEAFDLSVEYGAIVNEVLRDSPAEQAGLEEGDIIISFAGQRIRDYDDLVDLIEDHKPGDKATLVVTRDDDKLDLEVTLEGRPRDRRYRYSWFSDKSYRVPSIPSIPSLPSLPSMPSMSGLDNFYWVGARSGSYIGVHMMELPKQLGEYFGIERGRGVLITEVEEDSPAEAAGLKAGDVIIAVDGDKVFENEDVRDAVDEKKEGEVLKVTVMRDKSEASFEVKVGESDWDRDDDTYYFSAPDIKLHLPKAKGLHQGVYLNEDDFFFDREDFDDEMEDLMEELDDLKEELKELRHERKGEWKEALQELRDELEELEESLD